MLVTCVQVVSIEHLNGIALFVEFMAVGTMAVTGISRILCGILCTGILGILGGIIIIVGLILLRSCRLTVAAFEPAVRKILTEMLCL